MAPSGFSRTVTPMWSKSSRSNSIITGPFLCRGGLELPSGRPGAHPFERGGDDENEPLQELLEGVRDVENRQAVLQDCHECDPEEDSEDPSAAATECDPAQ